MVTGLASPDHAVEHLDYEGALTLLTRISAGAKLGPDQVLVAANRGLGQVAPAVTHRTLPAISATLGHELDMSIAPPLLARVGRARHR